jgi:membrane protein YqaA with SNARE-associated domain
MEHWIASLLALFALPTYGLTTVFVLSFVSATLLPLGSEPAVLGLIKLQPELFWQAIGVATLGNTLGGAVDWWIGYGANRALHSNSPKKSGNSARLHERAQQWLQKLGPKACLLSWLPLIGDPLCAVAGWLKLPFWPCLFYMAIGKFLRYTMMTGAFFGIFGG